MLDVCPICSRPLRNGVDGKQYIKYDPEYRAKFDAGEITLEELSEHITVYYDRQRLCFNEGNKDIWVDNEGKPILDINGKVQYLNPPCANFYGIRGGTIENPDVIVETVIMEDN